MFLVAAFQKDSELLPEIAQDRSRVCARTRICELRCLDDFHHGLVLDAGCLRFRLVCTGSTEPVSAVSNLVMLDSGASHASCCVMSEATRGQHAVADLVHEGAKACDSTAETEFPGLPCLAAPCDHGRCRLYVMSRMRPSEKNKVFCSDLLADVPKGTVYRWQRKEAGAEY